MQDESQADQMLSAASSEQLSTGRPVHTKKKVLRQQHTDEQNSTPSSHTGVESDEDFFFPFCF